MYENILLLYIVACSIAFLLRYRNDWREWSARFALAACLPVIGLFLPLFWSKKWHGGHDRYGRDLELDIFRHETDALAEESRLYLKPQSEKEINVVPIEEALLVNDLSSRRRVMIDLLKQDTFEYLEVLGMAVANEDTETSHYAVSAIVEIKRKLTLSLQELAVKYEDEAGDPYFLQTYASVLKSYMRSGFIDDRTLLMHKYTYSTVLQQLMVADAAYAEAYEEKINIDIELREYVSAENTALAYLEQFPNSEAPYLALMKVYYVMRSFELLQETLSRLKRSTVRLSNHALKIVRFWTEATQHEQKAKLTIKS